MDEQFTKDLNDVLKFFDKWTKSIHLPNDVKPLKDITSEEYKDSLILFFNSLGLKDISFRQWIEGFYNRNEIDFDYIDIMPWVEWVKLYFKIFSHYVDNGKIK